MTAPCRRTSRARASASGRAAVGGNARRMRPAPVPIAAARIAWGARIRPRSEQRRLVEPSEHARAALEREVAPAREDREHERGDAERDQHLRIAELLHHPGGVPAGEE